MKALFRGALELLGASLIISTVAGALYVLSPWWRAWECHAYDVSVTVRSSGQKGMVVGDPWNRTVPVKFADGTVKYYAPEELR